MATVKAKKNEPQVRKVNRTNSAPVGRIQAPSQNQAALLSRMDSVIRKKLRKMGTASGSPILKRYANSFTLADHFMYHNRMATLFSGIRQLDETIMRQIYGIIVTDIAASIRSSNWMYGVKCIEDSEILNTLIAISRTSYDPATNTLTWIYYGSPGRKAEPESIVLDETLSMPALIEFIFKLTEGCTDALLELRNIGGPGVSTMTLGSSAKIRNELTMDFYNCAKDNNDGGEFIQSILQAAEEYPNASPEDQRKLGYVVRQSFEAILCKFCFRTALTIGVRFDVANNMFVVPAAINRTEDKSAYSKHRFSVHTSLLLNAAADNKRIEEQSFMVFFSAKPDENHLEDVKFTFEFSAEAFLDILKAEGRLSPRKATMAQPLCKLVDDIGNYAMLAIV